MNKIEKAKRLADILAQQEITNFEENLSRARSINVGTAFGGTTEIVMRGSGQSYLFCIMQPVEVIELIHQLAANVGCHIHLQPRKDFSSWRGWRVTEDEKKHLQGHPPFVNDMAPHHLVGANMPPSEEQPGMKIQAPLKEQEHVVATKKTVNRRNSKRTTKAS